MVDFDHRGALDSQKLDAAYERYRSKSHGIQDAPAEGQLGGDDCVLDRRDFEPRLRELDSLLLESLEHVLPPSKRDRLEALFELFGEHEEPLDLDSILPEERVEAFFETLFDVETGECDSRKKRLTRRDLWQLERRLPKRLRDSDS